jgi:hypothetical protein
MPYKVPSPLVGACHRSARSSDVAILSGSMVSPLLSLQGEWNRRSISHDLSHIEKDDKWVYGFGLFRTIKAN